MNMHGLWGLTSLALAAVVLLAACGGASQAKDSQASLARGAGAALAVAGHDATSRSVANAATATTGPPARPAVLAAAPGPPTFTGDRAETERFVAYNRTIELTPAEEAVRVQALVRLPAPCCKNFTAATCCCPCNMARATWGLAKHLIAEQGLGAVEVREAVGEWQRKINPGGFSGEACFNGGCGRAFRHDGCGGMVEGELVF
jgi:hypothetical protein